MANPAKRPRATSPVNGPKAWEDIELVFGGGSSRHASSALLRMCSPVFDRMLGSGMQESQERVIKVEVATRDEFNVLYDLLTPGALSKSINKKHVDALLRLSDYYEIDFVKEACEEVLLQMPVTAQRLLQASKHGLRRQQERSVKQLGQSVDATGLLLLHDESPELLLAVACAMKGYAVCNREEVVNLKVAALRSSDMGHPVEVVALRTWTIRLLKERLVEEMGLSYGDVRMWDFFDNKIFATLEDELDAQLHDKRIMDGQPILLEERDNHGNFTFVSALRQNSSST